MTEGEPQFIGRKYSEEEISKAKKAIEKWRKEATEPIEGELEKTELDLRMIQTVKELLGKELKFLKIEQSFDIKPDQVHIFDGEMYRTLFGKEESGSMRSTHNFICINRGRVDTTARYFGAILHEAIHVVSTQKFYMSREKDIYDARVGYRLRSVWKKNLGPDADLFRGLNEFMVEAASYLILVRNVERLEKEFGITEEDINGPMYTYIEYGGTINSIIDKISSYRGAPVGRVYRNLVRGLFSKSMLALKDIDKIFGKGALRVLASMGGWEEDPLKDEENRKLVEEFFTTDNLERREELRKSILRERLQDGRFQNTDMD